LLGVPAEQAAATIAELIPASHMRVVLMTTYIPGKRNCDLACGNAFDWIWCLLSLIERSQAENLFLGVRGLAAA
jgi:hypothetical protein